MPRATLSAPGQGCGTSETPWNPVNVQMPPCPPALLTPSLTRPLNVQKASQRILTGGCRGGPPPSRRGFLSVLGLGRVGQPLHTESWGVWGHRAQGWASPFGGCHSRGHHTLSLRPGRAVLSPQQCPRNREPAPSVHLEAPQPGQGCFSPSDPFTAAVSHGTTVLRADSSGRGSGGPAPSPLEGLEAPLGPQDPSAPGSGASARHEHARSSAAPVRTHSRGSPWPTRPDLKVWVADCGAMGRTGARSSSLVGMQLAILVQSRP